MVAPRDVPTTKEVMRMAFIINASFMNLLHRLGFPISFMAAMIDNVKALILKQTDWNDERLKNAFHAMVEASENDGLEPDWGGDKFQEELWALLDPDGRLPGPSK